MKSAGLERQVEQHRGGRWCAASLEDMYCQPGST